MIKNDPKNYITRSLLVRNKFRVDDVDDAYALAIQEDAYYRRRLHCAPSERASADDASASAGDGAPG